MGRTVQNDPLQKFEYEVRIAGLPGVMGFAKVSGLKAELETTEYAEGGYKAIHKLPGREKVEPVTLEKGATDKALYTQYKLAKDGDPNFRTVITVLQKNRSREVVREWVLAEAWFKSWECDDLDATSSDVLMDKVVIEFEEYL